jgi:hypothetical protein
MGMKWSTHEIAEGCTRNIILKPEDKIPLEWPRRRWEYNIKMYLEEIGVKT